MARSDVPQVPIPTDAYEHRTRAVAIMGQGGISPQI